jgi:hypothetical protein
MGSLEPTLSMDALRSELTIPKPLRISAMKKQLSVMHVGLIFLGVFLPSSMAQEALPKLVEKAPAEIKDQYQVLFNGKDLTDWDGDPNLWSVKDGVIHGQTTPEQPANGNTFLIWTGGKPSDFELRFSFRCNNTNNSGVQYRSKHIDTDRAKNKWVVRGYQHEIRNENKFPNVSGFIYDEGGKRGRICLAGEQAQWEAGAKKVTGQCISAKEFEDLFRLDQWNDVVIVAQGNRIKHYLNDRLILDFTDKDPQLALTQGVLALQLHAGKPMWAQYKNIRLKELTK